jgi:hypothetical protein
MAQNTRKWDSLTGLVQARLGHDLSDKDLVRVQSLANSAALMLFDENPYWERFLVLEPRSVERGYVAFTEDSYNVYGAGTTEVNGLYFRSETDTNGKVAYELFNEDTVVYSLIWNGVSAWEILDADTGDILYDSQPGTEDTPPESGWAVNLGESTAPIVQALSEIGEYIGHWNGAKWQGAGSHAGTAYPDQNGIRMTDCTEDGVVYMAFKKTQPDTYGNGQSGTVSDVPAEWFNYMALQTAAAWDGAQDRPTVRVKDIDRAWDQALLKINRQGIYNNIAQRFRTYYGYDVSVR